MMVQFELCALHHMLYDVSAAAAVETKAAPRTSEAAYVAALSAHQFGCRGMEVPSPSGGDLVLHHHYASTVSSYFWCAAWAGCRSSWRLWFQLAVSITPLVVLLTYYSICDLALNSCFVNHAVADAL